MMSLIKVHTRKKYSHIVTDHSELGYMVDTIQRPVKCYNEFGQPFESSVVSFSFSRNYKNVFRNNRL